MGLEECIGTRRVGIVAYSAPPYGAGGVASAHYNLFRALERQGVDVRLFTFGDYKRADKENIIRRGAAPWISRYLKKLNGLFFGFVDRGKRAYQAIDILSSIIGSTKMERAISKFDPNVVILSDHGAPGLMLRKDSSTKWILVSHHNPARFIGEPYFSDHSEKDVAWAIRLENKVLAKVDAVVCPSKYMKTWFEATYEFSGEIYVIHNLIDEAVLGIDTNSTLYASMGLQKNSPIVYMPSAGSKLKGKEFVMEIIHRLASQYPGEIGFYIPGNFDPSFVEQMKTIPSSARLHSEGQLPYEEHIANMKACSFGISPSLMENYSMAILEAVCSGVPMLAFKTGGNEEIISNENNGFLANDGDVPALCAFAQKLLEENNFRKWKQKTFEYSQKHLSNEKALSEYVRLIE